MRTTWRGALRTPAATARWCWRAAFCIAAELRRIHDVLHEINQRDEAHRAQETI